MIRRYSSILKDYNGIINAVLLGDNSVGKTSILNRIKKEPFNSDENHTEQIVEYKYQYNSNKMKLDIIIKDVDNEKKNSKEFGNILRNLKVKMLTFVRRLKTLKIQLLQ